MDLSLQTDTGHLCSSSKLREGFHVTEVNVNQLLVYPHITPRCSVKMSQCDYIKLLDLFSKAHS